MYQSRTGPNGRLIPVNLVGGNTATENSSDNLRFVKMIYISVNKVAIIPNPQLFMTTVTTIVIIYN